MPGGVVIYVFVQRLADSGEVKKSRDVEIGSDVGEGLSREVEEECPAFWKRRRDAVLKKVSILGCSKGGRCRVLVLMRCVSGSCCGLIEHKLGEGKEHKL